MVTINKLDKEMKVIQEKKYITVNEFETIAEQIHALDSCSDSKRKVLIKVITDFHTLEGNKVVGEKKAGRRAIS